MTNLRHAWNRWIIFKAGHRTVVCFDCAGRPTADDSRSRGIIPCFNDKPCDVCGKQGS
jgi:hypothetical protein